MGGEDRSPPATLDETRRRPALSRENLDRQLGISCADVSRWGNGQSKLSKLARAQFDALCDKTADRGRLALLEGGHS